MKAKHRRLRTRRSVFIDEKGGDAFMPISRMKEIRWDEAVIRSKYKRDGVKVIWFKHVHFHCPTGCCLGTPIAQHDNPKNSG